jgi:uncharacterized membrane protein
MVLMALDHTREFFTSFPGNPLNPEQTTPWLYLTRWITHLCAPVFVFLAGTGIFLQKQRKTGGELTALLITRGIWLVVIELTLVHLVFNFHWQWNVQFLEVIWVIGVSMIVMAGLTRFGVRTNLLIAAILIVGHNSLDRLSPANFGPLDWLWGILHVPGALTGSPDSPPIIIVGYPVVPWIGVMALGYAFGSAVFNDKDRRIRWELLSGVFMLTSFVLLRWSNLYGDPIPWTQQAIWWRTLLSFFNLQKYPPSLLFLLATLGVAAIIMAGLERAERYAAFGQFRSMLQVYGRVPFFYFLLHLAFIHLLALLLSAARGGDWQWWLKELPAGGVLTGRPSGYGYGLPFVGSVWILVVSLCYPACKWYGSLKMRSSSRLFFYL